MKTPSNLSRTEKKQLAADLENEKNKIVASKVQNLQEQKILQQKENIARAIEQEEDHRRIQLQQAYENESGIVRFVYGLKSLITRIPPDELYHESLLNDLRSRIRKTSRGVILNSNNMISGRFIAKLYNACVEASQLHDSLKTVFKQPKCIELYTRYAFKNLYQDIEMNRDLPALVDLAALHHKIEEGSEALNEYLAEQRAVIRRYAKNVNPKFPMALSKDLNDLYQLFLFTSFDHKKFFLSLGGTAKSLKTGHFDDCPVGMSLKAPLENFYQFLPMFSGLCADEVKNNEVARYVFACAALIKKDEPDQTLDNVTKIASKDEDNNVKKLANFNRNWDTTIANYPFEDLIRLCNLSYFYEPKKPEIRFFQIKERVKKYIEQQLLFELELFVDETRENFNADAKQNLLIDYEHTMLEYYKQDSVVNPGRFYGVPGFGHVNEINIMHNFLTKYYAQNIKRILTFLIRTVLPKTSTLRTVMMNHSMSFDNLEERIRNFNSDLGPDKAWGKNLMNIIYRLEKNDTGNLVKQIKELVKEIDSEAELLLGQGYQIFNATTEQLQAIITTQNVKLREMLNVVMPNSQLSFLVGIENTIHSFTSIQALMHSYST